MVRALHRHCKGVGSIPAGGPIVHEFFSSVFLACILMHVYDTHTRLRHIYPGTNKKIMSCIESEGFWRQVVQAV